MCRPRLTTPLARCQSRIYGGSIFMGDPVRQEIAATSKTVVVKVGTRVLTHEDGSLDQDRVTAIAEQVSRLMAEKRQVVLVSSGAVGAGIGRLGLKQRPADLAHLQAVA